MTFSGTKSLLEFKCPFLILPMIYDMDNSWNLDLLCDSQLSQPLCRCCSSEGEDMI